MAKCNDQHSIGGVVYHCDQAPHQLGDHSNSSAGVTWFRHETGGARWTLRHPGAWVWHRVETSRHTACGLDIVDLSPRTVKGRTLSQPPAGDAACPECLAVAPGAELAHAA